MATTRLSDAVIPEVYQTYANVDDMARTDFYTGGVIAQNAALNALASGAGHSVILPFWKDLDAGKTPNISNDNPADVAAPDKIEAGKQVAFQVNLNKAWSSADLVAELAGSDPMRRIRERFSTYWTRQYQKRLIETAKGILADNKAANGGDMVYDISTTGSATEANLFGVTAFTGAVFTLGDAFAELGAIAMHSMVYKRLVDKNEVEVVRSTEGNLLYRAYKGLRIIIDDSMPVEAAGSGFKYTTVIFGQGAFGYGAGSARVPVEIDREPLQGNGGGVETIIERRTVVIHPFGFKAAEPAAVGGHTLTELASDATWERVVERKNVPMAFLVTNG